ncbi:MAG: hypothetical protein HeimC2_07420 [Candidatus Heimdallarchaeota archaeon LC_2]|nr:MAG: hypothetical protein HeimC2_07420 [Candidatus Heimdallarchaeota archaeon LC_2]
MQQSFTFNKLDKLNLIIIITIVGSGSIGYLIRNFSDSDTYSLFDLFLGIAGIIGLVTIPIWVVRYLLTADREFMRKSITFENLTKLMPILLMIFVGSGFLMVFLMFLFEEPIIFIILQYGGGIAGLLFMISIPIWVIAFLYRIIRPSPYKQAD